MLSGVTRRTATGPSEAGLSPAAALAHVPGMAKGRVAYEKRAWRVVYLVIDFCKSPFGTLFALWVCRLVV